MATHCSILAWELPWIEEPGGLHSMGSQRVRHFDFMDKLWFLSWEKCEIGTCIWLPGLLPSQDTFHWVGFYLTSYKTLNSLQRPVLWNGKEQRVRHSVTINAALWEWRRHMAEAFPSTRDVWKRPYPQHFRVDPVSILLHTDYWEACRVWVLGKLGIKENR